MRPTKESPISDESPVPKIASASPVGTWLELSSSTSTAKISADSAPPTSAPAQPSHGLPVRTVAPNPEIAPISIIPSTPRFSTPDFSTTSSPSPASRMGVVSPTTVISAEIMNSRLNAYSPGTGRPAVRGLETSRTR